VTNGAPRADIPRKEKKEERGDYSTITASIIFTDEKGSGVAGRRREKEKGND